jgi:hypothetical protein
MRCNSSSEILAISGACRTDCVAHPESKKMLNIIVIKVNVFFDCIIASVSETSSSESFVSCKLHFNLE